MEEIKELILSVTKRLDSIDSRLMEMDSRLVEMDSRLVEMDSRLIEMDSRLDRIENRLENVERNQEEFEKFVADAFIEDRREFNDLNKKIDKINGVIEGIDNRINILAAEDLRIKGDILSVRNKINTMNNTTV